MFYTVFTLQIYLLIMTLEKAVLYSIDITTIPSHHSPDKGST